MKLLVQGLLRKRDVRDILVAAHVGAATAPEIAHRTGIPIARCCRLLRILEAAGLVARQGVQVRRGGGRPLYRSRLENLELFLKSGRLWAKMEVPSTSARPSAKP